MGNLKSKLEAIFPDIPVAPKPNRSTREFPSCPDNYKFGTIAELYREYQAKLQGASVRDILGRDNWYLPENFPHLVKLEFLNLKEGKWVDASASSAIAQLENGTLDETRYRIWDQSRPRTLFWSPDILKGPDSIYPNKRNPKNEVYAKQYQRQGDGSTLKILLIETRNNGLRVVNTSFWSNHKYHAGCIAQPARYTK